MNIKKKILTIGLAATMAISMFAGITANAASPLYGDVNNDGRIDDIDVARLQQYISRWNVTINKTNSDVNVDGCIDSKDLARLQQYISGWKVTLGPSEPNSVSLPVKQQYQQGNTCMTTAAAMMISSEKNIDWNAYDFSRWAWNNNYFKQINFYNRNQKATNKGSFGQYGMFVDDLVTAIKKYSGQTIIAVNNFKKTWDWYYYKDSNTSKNQNEIITTIKNNLIKGKRCLVLISVGGIGHAIVVNGYTKNSDGSYTFKYTDPNGFSDQINADYLANSMLEVTHNEPGMLITLK